MKITTELQIEKLTYQGDGLARKDGMVWFVPFSAPGDTLEVELTNRKKSFSRGKIIRIKEPSLLRTTPQCRHFGECGGCQWQHIDYISQIEQKQLILNEMLEKSGIKDIDTIVRPSPQNYGYRNRISLHRIGQSIGYFSTGSRNLISVGDCPIAADPLREWLAEPSLSKKEISNLPERFELRLMQDGQVTAAADSTEGQFVQANTAGNAMLQAAVKQAAASASSSPRIFDLYCGDGNLSMPLAETARSITGWDISVPAIREAQKKSTASSEINYHVGDVKQIAVALRTKAKETDILILDPPREGIKNESAELADLNIPAVIYVSCNPAALTRDIKTFLDRGYSLKTLEGFDMFPQTYHLESVCLLVKKDSLLRPGDNSR